MNTLKHRTADTYPLSHFRQRTRDHLERLAEGRIETITQNGEAAMVVMSPETYDQMRVEMERGHLWDQAIARMNEEEGLDARQAVFQVAKKLGLEL